MIYLDTTRGRPRKWCSMQRCGNTAKAARHRRRHEERTPGDTVSEVARTGDQPVVGGSITGPGQGGRPTR
ncbi:CGNR zinc finger domain-containing protein [Streptomyces sp. 049-1]|uniref:CGNR zinc finger domain-containing protein n=1 Tax=Streptomyces sp. 049-1 TaxID=2789264 RepID=UPI0039807610